LRDPAQLRRQLDEFDASLKQKNKGALSISPYTLPGSIDAVRLLYIGLTTLDLTAREYGTPIYLHPNFSKPESPFDFVVMLTISSQVWRRLRQPNILETRF
jgi:hypothetical protein